MLNLTEIHLIPSPFLDFPDKLAILLFDMRVVILAIRSAAREMKALGFAEADQIVVEKLTSIITAQAPR